VFDLKKNYEQSVELINEASKNLGTLFKDRMVKVKTKMSRFFADTEILVNENN
jgi:hypothetical protein